MGRDRASNAERASNADLYQILAYATALDLPGGMLIYAKDDQSEANEATYTVRHAGKRLQVAALDLSGTLDDVLARVGAIAEDARALAERCCSGAPARGVTGAGFPPTRE